MLRVALDHIPQKKFYLIASYPLWTKNYPHKHPHQMVWTCFFVSLLPFFVSQLIKNDLGLEIMKSIFAVALASIGLLLVAAIVSNIRRLSSRRPEIGHYSILYGTGCVRLNLWIMTGFIAAAKVSDYFAGEKEAKAVNITLVSFAAIFVLSEVGFNIFMFRRIIRRIKEGHYLSNGTGFMDSNKPMDDIKKAIKPFKVVTILIVVLLLLDVFNGILEFADFDFRSMAGTIMFVIFVLMLVALNFGTAWFNTIQTVLLYCHKRFGNDLDDLAPIYVGPSEEELADDEWNKGNDETGE